MLDLLEEISMLEHQSQKHVDEIIKTLEKKFNKKRSEAVELVKKFAVHEDIMKNPIGLHDSPEAWALILLTENEDLEAIKYFYEQ